MDYGDFEDLIVNVEDGVGHWQINRPERLNAMRTQTFWEIIELGRRFQVDPAVRVVLATHEGRGFSSGADLTAGDDAYPRPDVAPPAAANDSMGVSGVGLAMPAIDKPTIASINGVAAGGGLGLATSFDIRYIGPEARFLTIFSRRALAPDCGLTYFLPRLVGASKALELLYTSEEIDAEQAVAIGLANSLHDDPDAKAWEVARELAAGPPLSYLWSKRDVQHSWAADVQGQIEFEWAGQNQVHQSEDVQEGRRAFLEKRAPVFEGR